jgi:hypothetical protein
MEEIDAALVLIDAAPPPAPDPVSTPPVQIACAMCISVDAEDVSAILGSYNIAAVMRLDVGLFLVVLFQEQPDTDYFVQTSATPPTTVTEIDKATDSVTLQVVGSDGETPTDPSRFSLSMWRFK